MAHLFWATNDLNEIKKQTLNFDTKTTSLQDFSIDFKKHYNIVEFKNNDNFYKVTYHKKSKELFVHSFLNDGSYQVKTIDVSKEVFITSDYKKITFDDILVGNSSGEKSIRQFFQFVDYTEYTALPTVASLRKAYVVDNNLVLTSDKSLNHTDLITIDLNTFELSRKTIQKPVISFINYMKSNSFIYDNAIYLLKINSDCLVLEIKDLNGNLINKLGTMADEDIVYSLQGIKQLNGDVTKEKEITKTKNFIRKFQNLRGGLNVYDYKGKKLITVGAVGLEQNSNYATIGLIGFGVTGAVVGAILDANISNNRFNNLDHYSNRKVVYFNTSVNSDLQVDKVELNILALEKISEFLRSNNKVKHVNLTVKNKIYYLGYFSDNSNKYNWKPFVD